VLSEPAIEAAQEEEASGADLPHKTIQPDLIDRHPQVLAARAARARAEAKLRETGHARREPIEVGMGLRWQRDEARQPRDRSMGFSVRVPLGQEPRAPHAYATALTEVDVLRSEEQRAVEAVERDMHEAEAALSASKASTASSAQRARQAWERLALIRTAFDMGEQSMAERLRAEAAAIEASQQLARDRAALGRAQARFEQAEGLLP
jgi:cobalt-zinc-cadmium efflux system outer membrane protein